MRQADPAEDLVPAAQLLAELRSRGLQLAPRGADRIWVAPIEMLDEGTLQRVRAMKSALLSILLSVGHKTWCCTRCGRYAFHLPTICFWCRKAEEREHHA